MPLHPSATAPMAPHPTLLGDRTWRDRQRLGTRTGADRPGQVYPVVVHTVGRSCHMGRPMRTRPSGMQPMIARRVARGSSITIYRDSP